MTHRKDQLVLTEADMVLLEAYDMSDGKGGEFFVPLEEWDAVFDKTTGMYVPKFKSDEELVGEIQRTERVLADLNQLLKNRRKTLRPLLKTYRDMQKSRDFLQQWHNTLFEL